MHLCRFPYFIFFAAALLWSAPASAQPSPYPPDSSYSNTQCGSQSSWDYLADGAAAKKSRDIVGDATHPALYLHSDPTYAYFRIRVDTDPVVTTVGNWHLRQFGWGVGLDTNNDANNIEYNIIANGITEVVNVVRVSDSKIIATFQPTLDTSSSGPGGQTYAPRYVEVKVTGDGSNFNSNVDYFITFAVPKAAVSAAMTADPSPLNWSAFRLWAATSSNGVALNGDFMCWNNAIGKPKLPGSISGSHNLGPKCDDKVKNGSETDVDCGGSTCPKCKNGKDCKNGSDCLSGVCDPTTKKCVPTAVDGGAGLDSGGGLDSTPWLDGLGLSDGGAVPDAPVPSPDVGSLLDSGAGADKGLPAVDSGAGADKGFPAVDSGAGADKGVATPDSGAGGDSTSPGVDSGAGTDSTTPTQDSGAGTDSSSPAGDSGAGADTGSPTTDSGAGADSGSPTTDSGTGADSVSPTTDTGAGADSGSPAMDSGAGADQSQDNDIHVFGGGGCNCDTAGEGIANFLWLLPLAVVLGFRRRRRLRRMSRGLRYSSSALAAILVLLPASVNAKPVQLSIMRFRPAASVQNFYVPRAGRSFPI